MTVLALIGAKALYLLYAWLASAIIASWLSGRKGWGEKPGLASGLLLPVISVVVWLAFPVRGESFWKFRRSSILGPSRRSHRSPR